MCKPDAVVTNAFDCPLLLPFPFPRFGQRARKWVVDSQIEHSMGFPVALSIEFKRVDGMPKPWR